MTVTGSFCQIVRTATVWHVFIMHILQLLEDQRDVRWFSQPLKSKFFGALSDKKLIEYLV